MSQALNAQVLDYIEATGEALEASTKLASATMAQHKKIAAVVPQRVEALVNAHLLDASEKQAAFNKLSSHEGSLEVVSNLAQHCVKLAAELVQARAAQGPGQPGAAEKKASASSTSSNYLGRRHGVEDQPESWNSFERSLGL